MKTVADRIRWILDRQGWSQRELSRRAGLALSHVGLLIGRFDRDPDAPVELATLKAIARAGRVSEQWMITGRGGPLDRDEAAGGSAPQGANCTQQAKMGERPDWSRFVELAKLVDPAIPQWAFDVVAQSNALAAVPMTAAMLADLARVVMKHAVPPGSAERPAKASGPRRRSG